MERGLFWEGNKNGEWYILVWAGVVDQGLREEWGGCLGCGVLFVWLLIKQRVRLYK